MKTRQGRLREPPIDSSPPSAAPGSSTICPFCLQQFKRLGCHIHKCKERDGRDYAGYLSEKTRRKRDSGMRARVCCPKCLRSFERLDTHLRTSATCKDVQVAPVGDIQQPPPAPTGETDTNTGSSPRTHARVYSHVT